MKNKTKGVTVRACHEIADARVVHDTAAARVYYDIADARAMSTDDGMPNDDKKVSEHAYSIMMTVKKFN